MQLIDPPPGRKKNRRPTLGNHERRIMAAMIQSKMPGITIDWTSGHGTFLSSGRRFCTITREGDLSLYLPPDRMEELVGKGEAAAMRFGDRIVPGCVVIDARTDPRWALKLLQEARRFAEGSSHKDKQQTQ